MRKYLLILLLLCITLACTVSFKDDDVNQKMGTQVSVALTATALDEYLSTEATAAEGAQQQPKEPTQTPESSGSAKDNLGNPTWHHDLSSWASWSETPDEKVVDSTTTFSISNGKLKAESTAVGKGNHWWLNYNEFEDAYLEAKFDTGNCSGDDQYGLAFRAAEYYDGIAYYFHVTCNGHYDLRKWTASGSTMMLGMPSSDKIISGPNQSNILGVRVNGNSIHLYMNDHLIHEIEDSDISGPGHFGIFINARQTPGFTIYLDEISYWLLD